MVPRRIEGPPAAGAEPVVGGPVIVLGPLAAQPPTAGLPYVPKDNVLQLWTIHDVWRDWAVESCCPDAAAGHLPVRQYNRQSSIHRAFPADVRSPNSGASYKSHWQKKPRPILVMISSVMYGTEVSADEGIVKLTEIERGGWTILSHMNLYEVWRL